MLPGHFAAALALKAREPRAPNWALLTGVGLLDLLFGVFVFFGAEGTKDSANFILNIPWSHSLVMAILWSALFAGLFYQMGERVAAVIFIAVFSHWILDAFVHGPDMPLWPGASLSLGGREIFGRVGGWFEVAFTLAAAGYYVAKARTATDYGRYWIASIVLLAGLWALELWATHPTFQMLVPLRR
jgi:membrane-bound metal-dependent hydrolase YbcI (DUF457 family)